MIDLPNERSSHAKPTATGGGLVFVFISSITSLVGCFLFSFGFAQQPLSLFLVPLLSLPLALVGFWDDRYSLHPGWRYLVQILTAFALILISPLISLSFGLLPLLLLLVVITAVINFVNFMDGLDGLVSGCMSVILSAVALDVGAPWPIWCLVGSLIAFLFFNWSPATIFMGDVGSTFLGAVFVGLLLQAGNWVDAFGYFLIGTPLLADACLCVLRRFFAGQRIFRAHRLHLFQRLHLAGLPHSRVSFIYIFATVVLAVSLFFGGLPWLFILASAVILLGFWLDRRVAVPFAVASDK